MNYILVQYLKTELIKNDKATRLIKKSINLFVLFVLFVLYDYTRKRCSSLAVIILSVMILRRSLGSLVFFFVYEKIFSNNYVEFFDPPNP